MALITFSEPYPPLSGWLILATLLTIGSITVYLWGYLQRNKDPEVPLARVGAAILMTGALFCIGAWVLDRTEYFYAMDVFPERVLLHRVDASPWWIERSTIDSLRLTPMGKNGARCQLTLQLKNGQKYRSTQSDIDVCKAARHKLQE